MRTNIVDFERLPIKLTNSTDILTLNDLATVKIDAKENDPVVFANGHIAVDIFISRLLDSDSFETAEILDNYLVEVQKTLPPGYKLEKYYEFWKIIKDRLTLLLNNGIGGFILIFAILLLFLNIRVATWVSLGVPISFAAALVILYLMGTSINMIASLGFLMSLGIIVK